MATFSADDATSITIDRRARPLRFGFVVDARSGESVRKGIEAATALWGGAYCPLIPMFRTAPSEWLKFRSTKRRPSPAAIGDGYIQLFRPDYLVETIPGLAAHLAFPSGRVLELGTLFDAQRGLSHGVGATDIYRALYAKEYRFVHRDQQPFVLPRLNEPALALLSAAWFGSFSNDANGASIEAAYLQEFGAERVDVGSATAYEPRGGTPLRAGRQGLDVSPRGYIPGAALLVLDPRRPQDVVDYWNLRALGWGVLPLPLGWVQTAEAGIRALIERAADRDAVQDRVHLVGAQSVSREALLEAVKPFQGPKVVIGLHPRLWDTWGRGADHVARPVIGAGELRGDVELRERDRYKIFYYVVPDLLRHVDTHPNRLPPSWATVVNLRSFASFENGTAFPPTLQNLPSLFRAVSDLWLSDEGIVAETSLHHTSELWEFPRGLDIFAAWAKEAGFEYTVSAPGRLLAQMVKRLGGLGGAGTIRHVPLLETLNKMAHQALVAAEDKDAPTRSKARGGTISANDLRTVLRPAHLQEIPIGASKEERATIQQRQERIIGYHISHLVEQDVLRVGVRLECPHCGQWTWYGLQGLAPTLECERCLQAYEFPAGSPTDAEWHYRPVGPFAVEHYAHGAYAVILALRFLLQLDHHDAVSWSPSFELTKGGAALEADFGAFVRPEGWVRPPTTLLLGECKCGERRFDHRDFRRARELLKAFPTAALVFATTRRELTPSEKTGLKRIVRGERDAALSGRPSSPVLVLTEWELSSGYPAPLCWKDHPRLTTELKGRMDVRGSVTGLADATQQLHLDLQSIDAEVRERLERALQKRAALAATNAPQPMSPAAAGAGGA